MTDDVSDYMAKQRERLMKEREGIAAQQQQLIEKLEMIDREIHAIDVYEATRKGKAPTTSRLPRGTHRETVLSLLTATPGLAPKEIKARLGAQAPKGLHNLLGVLTQQGKVVKKAGKYTIVP